MPDDLDCGFAIHPGVPVENVGSTRQHPFTEDRRFPYLFRSEGRARLKKLSQGQIIGQRGEHLVADRTLAMGFAYTQADRLETGVDGFLELRDRQTRQTLGKWIGVQVKTTEAGAYVGEDATTFQYLLRAEDLEYWRAANIPVIVVLVRLSDGTMYWKPVDAGSPSEARRLVFDKAADVFDKRAADQIAALCVDRSRLGSYVPPMQSGEPGHLTMVRLLLPERIFVGASLFASGREAARELVGADPHAPFDWVVRDRRFFSFRDPRGTALSEIVDEGSVESVETETVALPDELDDEYLFIELLGRTLSAQLDKDLSYDRESRALYFRTHDQNSARTYRYRSLVNETSAEVVSLWRRRDGAVGSVRHHAFIPRFLRIGDEWYLSITPTFVFTYDGFRPHRNASALISGKKKLEKEGAVRGQFVMWRHLVVESGRLKPDLLATGRERAGLLRFEPLDALLMPLAVPEETWRREDPNAATMVDTMDLL